MYLQATARRKGNPISGDHGTGTWLETNVTFKSKLRRSNFNTQELFPWGVKLQNFATFGRVFVLDFKQPDYACFGFSIEWVPTLDYPNTNPTKLDFHLFQELVTMTLDRARLAAS